MGLNKLREELQEILSGTDSFRPAAVRRSLRKEYLYATDLPRCAGISAVRDFRGKAENAGWTAEESGDWIQLDRHGALPADAGFDGPFGPEADCCAELLQRHPKKRIPGETEIRLLIKAGEEGPEAYEKACAGLHRVWAAALRRGNALPDIPVSCFRKEKENGNQTDWTC